MAEQNISGFRSKFGGFKKEDVLEYINTLQEEHAREIAEWQQQTAAQREAYEKALGDANRALVEQFDALQAERAEQEQLQRLVNEQYEANRVLRDQAARAAEAKAAEEDLNARLAAAQQLVQALQKQNAELQRQTAVLKAQQSEQEQAALRERTLRQQVAAAQAEASRAREENRRYRELVHDVGSFVVEVRAMGQRYLDDANERCQSRLGTLLRVIGSLNAELAAAESELTTAGDTLSTQNSSAEQRLDELARELERSAAGIEEVTPAAESAAAHFF